MKHLDTLSILSEEVYDEFKIKATGKYYTHPKIAEFMYKSLFEEVYFKKLKKIKIVDPFAGDGRLVFWLVEKWIKMKLPDIIWDIYLFDIDEIGLKYGKEQLEKLIDNNIQINITIKTGDSFELSKKYKNTFDIVVTNPPWELLKPDKRELTKLTKSEIETYKISIKDYDSYLSKILPLSQPKKKFAGWGTNLSRVGMELSFSLCKKNGFSCIVLPASFFADSQSLELRKHIILGSSFSEICYYPAEAKLFGKADVSVISLVFQKKEKINKKTCLSVFDKNLKLKSSGNIDVVDDTCKDFIIPVSLGYSALEILKKLQVKLTSWEDIESKYKELWAGRELDETGSKHWLTPIKNSFPSFIKGRMVNRYSILHDEKLYIEKNNFSIPNSTNENRIAWRDISRPSQKRRLIATLIPSNTIAGNSLGIVLYKNGDIKSLYALLGLMNSLCFEFQLRCYLSTGHISLSALRKVYIPRQSYLRKMTDLITEVENRLNNDNCSESRIEAIVARDIYKLTKKELIMIMNSFDKLSLEEKEKIIEEFESKK